MAVVIDAKRMGIQADPLSIRRAVDAVDAEERLSA